MDFTQDTIYPSIGLILSRNRITKTLIRLCRCAGWSVSLLYAFGISRFWHGVIGIQTSSNIWATSWENLFMPYAKNKGADQPAHPRSLVSTFVVRCLDSIIPLVSMSEISSLYLSRPVWGNRGRKPRRQVFSWRGWHLTCKHRQISPLFLPQISIGNFSNCGCKRDHRTVDNFSLLKPKDAILISSFFLSCPLLMETMINQGRSCHNRCDPVN